MAQFNLHNSRASFEVNGKSYNYFRLAALEEAGIANVSRLPYSIKVLLESVLRQYDNYVIKEEHVNELAKFGSSTTQKLKYHSSLLALYYKTSLVYQ